MIFDNTGYNWSRYSFFHEGILALSMGKCFSYCRTLSQGPLATSMSFLGFISSLVASPRTSSWGPWKWGLIASGGHCRWWTWSYSCWSCRLGWNHHLARVFVCIKPFTKLQYLKILKIGINRKNLFSFLCTCSWTCGRFPTPIRK